MTIGTILIAFFSFFLMVENSPAQETMNDPKAIEIPWDELKDPHQVKDRELDNRAILKFMKNHPVFGSGFILEGAENSNLKMVLDENSSFSTPSGTMSVKMFNISIDEKDAPDPKLYSVLGVGTSLELPDQWINIFGLGIKGGYITIKQSGIELSKSEIKR